MFGTSAFSLALMIVCICLELFCVTGFSSDDGDLSSIQSNGNICCHVLRDLICLSLCSSELMCWLHYAVIYKKTGHYVIGDNFITS